MERENEEKKEAGNVVESSAAAKSSENEIPKSLKARSKIAKKSPINDLKTKKAKIAARAWSRFRKKKKINLLDEKNDNNNIEGESSKKLNSREENLNENLLKEKDPKPSRHSQKNQEEIGGLDKSHRKQRGEEEIGGADKNLWKQRGERKIPVSDNSLKNQKEKEKQRDAGRSQEKEMRKDKLGGLIFMCSKKTKPDCFHYRVMGVSGSRKDLVLGIKPGLKLFLYDFDLKLMYGIYKASSSGGMKLEPKAFGGAFPAQVRFDIHRDSLPLPESVFKKAIKENYDEKHKFKIELTPKQVRKLSELFRPAAAHSTALPVLTAPVPKVQDKEVHVGVRESNWEKFARDPYANASSMNYNGLSSERDRRITFGKGSSFREEVPCHFYMTEKEYRAYGLEGERKTLTTNHISAPLDPYQRGHERRQEHRLRHPDPTYCDTIPVSMEPVRADALRLTEREYHTYNVGSRHELLSTVSPVATTLDTYHRKPYGTYYYGASSVDPCSTYYYHASSVDPYLPLPRREHITLGSYSAARRRENYLVGTDPIRRGETDQADRLYSSYAASALSNYSRQHPYEGRKPELVAAPVSSRIPKPNVGKPSVLGTSRNSTKKRKRKSVIESDKSSEGVDVEVQEKDGKYSRQNFVPDAGQQHRRSSKQRQKVLYSEKITDDDSFSSPKTSKGSKPDRSREEELQEAGVRGGLYKNGTSTERELKQKASSIEESMPNKKSNTSERKAEGKEAEISDCDDGSMLDPEIIEYPDPDFSDFDKVREENCFAVNQTWAIYDTRDGMPRFYARIRKVFSPHFRLQITWLEPNPDDESEKAWRDSELPIACGKFINGKTEETEDRLMFSHQISWMNGGGRRSFLTYPKVGETWAIFSDWDIMWGRDPEKHRPPYQYEFVEVLTDFDENVGIGVAYLSKVNGFVSLFKQTEHHGVIPPARMYRFSHQIPSYRMTGKEREDIPVGSFEFDPASLPASLNKLEDFQGKGQQLSSSRQRQNVLYNEKINDGDFFSSPKRSKGSKPDRTGEEELQEAGDHGGVSKDGTSSERELKQKASSIEESMPNKKTNTREHKAEGKEAEISDCDDGSTRNPEIIEYPDPDFNDFDKIRGENCFAVNQTWAIYDPCDGMPRFYARIKKVFLPHFRLQITWLEPNPDDESKKAWCDVELPIGCGKFINGKTEDTEDRLMFSHQISSINSVGRRSFLIYPKVGETWAIFSDWDIKWGSDPEKHRPPYQYEFVEVLTDFDENVGIGVAYLGKVNGFVSLFKQTAHHGVIPPAHMYRFSHQIPSYRMTGKEREEVPVGSFELDPASLPTCLNKLEDFQGKGQQLRRSSKQRQNVLYSEKITDGDSFSPPKSSTGSKPDRSSIEELQEAGVRGGLSKDGTSTERELKQKASSIEESMPNKKSNTTEQKAGRKEADVSDYDDGSSLNSEIIEYPDPDFSDFDKVREENCFAVNQTWAIYDACDGMPRFYARIRKVFSPHFRLQITWLEPNPDDESEKAWRDDELPIACGKFINGKTEETEDRLMFSHQISWMNGGGRRSFLTYPKVGETWAIFSDWDIMWGRDPEKHRPPYQYEFVEVLTDFDENVGIGVAYLSKVNGFVSLFKQTAHHGVIPPAHMYRFSHQTPSYRMTGKEREDVPVGSFEFDPASLPSRLNKLEELSA